MRCEWSGGENDRRRIRGWRDVVKRYGGGEG